jgi:hypothetical protein
VVSAIVLLVAVATAIVLSIRSPSSPPEGPLDQWGAPFQSIGMPANADRAYSHGTLYVVNHAAEPVMIREVELVGSSPGLELLGARFVAGSTAGVGTDYGFPPGTGRTGVPAVGAVVSPEEPGQIIVGFAVTHDGVFTSSGVAISYALGRRVYRDVFPVSLRVCAPRHEDGEIVDCPTLLQEPVAASLRLRLRPRTLLLGMIRSWR